MKQSLAVLAALAGLSSAYYSGELRTKETFTYGKFRTRMQGTNQKGTVQSFFTYWSGNSTMPWSEQE